jgi:hypothetical protein
LILLKANSHSKWRDLADRPPSLDSGRIVNAAAVLDLPKLWSEAPDVKPHCPVGL